MVVVYFKGVISVNVSIHCYVVTLIDISVFAIQFCSSLTAIVVMVSRQEFKAQ